MMIQFRTVELDEVQIHYARAPGPEPALVILHGITGSHASFLPLMPALAQRAHVYALDLRGHNLSGRTAGAYQVPDYGRDVVAFLRTVVGRPAVVAGHSLGGLIAVWLAAQAPDWVRSVSWKTRHCTSPRGLASRRPHSMAFSWPCGTPAPASPTRGDAGGIDCAGRSNSGQGGTDGAGSVRAGDGAAASA